MSDRNYEKFDTLFKTSRRNLNRFWYMEREGDRYRSVYGVVDGDPVESGWTTAKPKNVGKANETTAVEQAKAEIKADYIKKMDKGYAREGEESSAKFTKPMLAQDFVNRRSKLPEDTDFYIQPKLDGIRCIARVDGLWTRQGKPITSCPHIIEALEPIFKENPELILDGELYNHALKDDFNKITSVVRKTKPTKADIATAAGLVEYHIYDIVDEDEDFHERTLELIALLGGGIGALRRVPTKRCLDLESVDTWYAKWLEEGYEGQMVRLNGMYEIDKRSNNLMKRKEFITEEYEVVRVHEGEGNWRGCIKRFTLKLPDGRHFGAGVRGTQEEMAKLLESGKTPDWATVRYFTLTPDGVPRFPVVIDYGTGTRQD